MKVERTTNTAYVVTLTEEEAQHLRQADTYFSEKRPAADRIAMLRRYNAGSAALSQLDLALQVAGQVYE